jgi:cellulose synthase/poly-beta-1,6-N-acetylglucosamine synthase-like glycosyltransferase
VGKNACLNAARPLATGAVLVFSDANSRFLPDCMRTLVLPLGDPLVGCAVGRLVLLDGKSSGVARSEAGYWSYEHWLRIQEGRAGELLTANGALLAIRRADWRELRTDIANDFATPMQVSSRGLSVVYVPAAVALERPTEAASDEFARKTRIVLRGLTGAAWFFGGSNWLRRFELVSHKALRWFIGWLALELWILGWFLRHDQVIGTLFLVQTLALVLGLGGLLLQRVRVLAPFGYALMLQAASVWATLRFLIGTRASSWRVRSRPRLATRIA